MVSLTWVRVPLLPCPVRGPPCLVPGPPCLVPGLPWEVYRMEEQLKSERAQVLSDLTRTFLLLKSLWATAGL